MVGKAYVAKVKTPVTRALIIDTADLAITSKDYGSTGGNGVGVAMCQIIIRIRVH